MFSVNLRKTYGLFSSRDPNLLKSPQFSAKLAWKTQKNNSKNPRAKFPEAAHPSPPLLHVSDATDAPEAVREAAGLQLAEELLVQRALRARGAHELPHGWDFREAASGCLLPVRREGCRRKINGVVSNGVVPKTPDLQTGGKTGPNPASSGPHPS